MKLILIRGAPGSGKSTLAMKLRDELDGVHLETDMFFIGENGVYRFDRALLKDNHEECRIKTRVFLECQIDVIVSNTFTKLWELQPYLDMAKECGADVTIYHCTGMWGNTHEVPEDVVARMIETYEPHPEDIEYAG